MSASPRWHLTPRESIDRECTRRGRAAVLAGCVRLVAGEDVDPGLVVALGGPAAHALLDGRPHADTYWLRVRGVRGLLWAWDGGQLSAVTAALGDESWRVREMAAKVVARHLLGDLLEQVALLREDPVPRVRAAGTRAVEVLTAAGA